MPTLDPSFEAGLDQVGRYEVADAAVNAAAAKGILPRQQPVWWDGQQYLPDQEALPPNLAQVSDDDLGSWLGRFSNRLAYIGDQLPIAEEQMRAAKKEVGFIYAKLYMVYKYDEHGKKATEPERKNRVTIDSRYLDADVRLDYCETYYKILLQAYKNTEQDYAAVSRRISQRQQDVERGRRDANVGSATPSHPVFRRPSGM